MSDTLQKPRRKSASPRHAKARLPQKISYQKPESQQTSKAITSLCQSDIIRGAVQIVQEGGDNNLYSDTGMDGFWMVLKGAVRFYGPGDELLGEFGVHEGVLIPRDVKCWFESSGDEDLELLQVVEFDRNINNERFDVSDRKSIVDSAQRFGGWIRD